MIDHRRFLDLAASSIDFELSAVEMTALEAHAADCEACRRTAEGYRSDAIALAALPAMHLPPDRSAAVLHRVVRPRRVVPPVRTLLVAAVLAILAAGIAVTVGAELLRRAREDQLSIVPPPPPNRVETPLPSSPGVQAYELEEAGAIPTDHDRLASIAVGPGGELVVVGGFRCVTNSDAAQPSCITPITSTETFDSATWAAVDAGTAGDVGGVTVSGPEPGIVAVAGSDDGFVAVGYADDGGFGGAVWRQRPGGRWERLPRDPAFDEARMRTVASTRSGWVIGGETFAPAGPRAAIWTSVDGRTWRRVDDDPAFDIGGYLDTGEEPSAGGITDIASVDGRTIAVGRTCDERGELCSAAAWVSDDGRDWTRASVPAGSGPLSAVASFSGGFIAFVGDGSSPEEDPILVSADGLVWHAVTPEGFPTGMEARAAARVGDGVAVLVSHEGRLAVLGSSDGLEWTTLHSESFELTQGVTPEPGTVVVADADMAEARDGTVVVVGWVDTSNVEPSGMRFVYRVSAMP